MSDTKITQTNNVAGGDIAGRDIIKTQLPDSPMGHLIKKYHDEIENSTHFSEIIDALNHLITYKKNSVVKGLEEKLSAGNREDEIFNAQEAKERVSKKIMRSTFSRSAQQIYAFILGDILSRFERIIKPKIHDGEKKSVIDELVYKEIISPVLAMLEQNPLDIFTTDIDGMIYFLTGNCHIEWI